MRDQVFKACGVVVSSGLLSSLGYAPSLVTNQSVVDNTELYTSSLDNLLAVFDHNIGGRLRRYFDVFTPNPQHQ